MKSHHGSTDLKKVVFILASYSMGGTEFQLANLIEHRPAWASEVEIETITFLPPRSAALVERFESLGVRNTEINRDQLRFYEFFRKLVGAIRLSRPDIVHTLLDSSTGAWGRLAALLAGVATIVHSDRSLMEEGTRVHRFMRPFLDRTTVRFLPNADAIARRLRAAGVPSRKITVIPSGVDMTRFQSDKKSSFRQEWNLPEGAVVAGYLGRFAPVKRLDVLLEAVLRVPVHHRPDALVLAGDGPELSRVQAAISQDAWLQEKVVLMGACDDVPRFLAGIDYLVLSSEMEGAPNSVLEAMAMSKPVVATDVSDLAEILDGVGFLADPGDPGSLADAWQRMQRTPESERLAMGLAARERVLERFDISVVAERFWEAHRDALNRRRQ